MVKIMIERTDERSGLKPDRPAADTAYGAAGGFAEAPANESLCLGQQSDVVQIHGQGPFAITYVSPADDPRGKSQASK
jgi:hypothetical protein